MLTFTFHINCLADALLGLLLVWLQTAQVVKCVGGHVDTKIDIAYCIGACVFGGGGVCEFMVGVCGCIGAF